MRVKQEAKNYHNYRILLLDDDAKFVDKKIEVLKSYGYQVEGETTVKRALSKLHTNEYDLLILDYLMDEMRGDKVVEEIRKFDKNLYILLLTGYAEAPALEIMENLDITAYCEKSNDNHQLLILIKSALKAVEMMKKVKKTKDGLEQMLRSAPRIYKLQPMSKVLKSILSELVLILDAHDAFIFVDSIVDPENHIINTPAFSGIGAYANGIETVSYEIMQHINYVKATKELDILENGLLMPILSERYDSLGVLYLKLKQGQFGEEHIGLFKVFAAIAASSITNALLQSVIDLKDEELHSTKEEVATWYLSTVNTIRLAIDAKDHYTCGHSDRVSQYAVKIGKAFNLSEDIINLLRDSGVFHDVGKIGIDDSILKKTGSITEEEYEEIKKHPQRGALILSAVSMFKDIVPVVLYHHERFDGKGYPNGLKGEEIPFLSRILCVADALDAMTTNRTYRAKKSAKEARAELEKGSGTQFDPKIVKVTIELIDANIIEIEQ